MSNIENEMSLHVDARHKAAQREIKAARGALKRAVAACVEVGELLAKVKSHHSGTIHTWSCENTSMDGEQSRAYMSVHYVDSKRSASEDKRSLQLLGILKKAPARKPRKAKKTTTPATVASKASASILKSLESRPISEMTPDEREILKMNLEGVARLFVEISSEND